MDVEIQPKEVQMLDKYIKERGIPAAELARRISAAGRPMSRQYLNNIIHGARAMPVHVAGILAELWSLDPAARAGFFSACYPSAAPSVEDMAQRLGVVALAVWSVLFECLPKMKAK